MYWSQLHHHHPLITMFLLVDRHFKAFFPVCSCCILLHEGARGHLTGVGVVPHTAGGWCRTVGHVTLSAHTFFTFYQPTGNQFVLALTALMAETFI